MSIIKNAKEIADLVKKLGETELYRKIIELESEIVDLTREKMELEEKLTKSETDLNLKKKMVFKKPLYYMEGDGQPFCPHCWETDTKAIHLVGPSTFGYVVDTFLCTNCDNQWSEEKYFHSAHIKRRK